jgi:hypothetical protein
MNHEATIDGAKGNILLATPRITLAVIVFITHVLAMHGSLGFAHQAEVCMASPKYA